MSIIFSKNNTVIERADFICIAPLNAIQHPIIVIATKIIARIEIFKLVQKKIIVALIKITGIMESLLFNLLSISELMNIKIIPFSIKHSKYSIILGIM